MCVSMSQTQVEVVIQKAAGAACGFTLVRNSCTVNRIIDSVSEELRPGDSILAINGEVVDEVTIRDFLRRARDLTQVHVVVSRVPMFNSMRFTEQARILGIDSPVAKRKVCFSCCSAPPVRRQSSSIGSYSPHGLGSVHSAPSSTGVRTVDLRKLQKEGAGSIWKPSREPSIKEI